MLLVTLFAPPEELSAAAALGGWLLHRAEWMEGTTLRSRARGWYSLSLTPTYLDTREHAHAHPTHAKRTHDAGALYYFALAHQADFDVRWARGPVGELIMAPLADRLRELGVTLLGGRRVSQVLPAAHHQGGGGAGRAGAVVATAGPPGAAVAETHEADAVVLATGVTALQQLVAASPLLAAAPDLRAVGSLRAGDVLAARVFLDRRVRLRFASNVMTGFDPGCGATLFDLTALHGDDAHAREPGSVLELDVYRAEALAPLSDDAVVERVVRRYLPAAAAGGAAAVAGAAAPRVLDASVVRVRRATTVFAPGSEAALPPVATSLGNVFVAGDCVAQGPGTHGAKGLSQEKALVAGIEAGNGAARLLGLAPRYGVLPVEPDEAHVAAAKELARVGVGVGGALRDAARSVGLPVPIL